MIFGYYFVPLSPSAANRRKRRKPMVFVLGVQGGGMILAEQ